MSVEYGVGRKPSFTENLNLNNYRHLVIVLLSIRALFKLVKT